MKHLDDQAFGDLLRNKLGEVRNDGPTPEWHEIEAKLQIDGYPLVLKFTSVVLMLSLLFLLPLPIENYRSNQPTFRSKTLGSVEKDHKPIQNHPAHAMSTSSHKDQRVLDLKTLKADQEETGFENEEAQAVNLPFNQTKFLFAPFPNLDRKSDLLPTIKHDPMGLYLPLILTDNEVIAPYKKSLLPNSINLSSQVIYHTLRPFKGDENRIAPSDAKVNFFDRWGFGLRANYHWEFLNVKWELGPQIHYYRSELNYVITNSAEPEGVIVNERLDAGVHMSMLLPLERISFPGYAYGGMSFQHQLLGAYDPSSTYRRSLVFYEFGYGFPVARKQHVTLAYRSFLNDQGFDFLGKLRPHIYSIGYQWSF